MKPERLAAWLVAGVALAIAAAPVAIGDPVFPTAGNESASATIGDLQAQGFSVTVNYLQGHPQRPPDRMPGERNQQPEQPVCQSVDGHRVMPTSFARTQNSRMQADSVKRWANPSVKRAPCPQERGEIRRPVLRRYYGLCGGRGP